MPGRVMIFDDDTDLLEVCSIVLKSKNYLVNALNKCDDIIQEVKAFSPNVILMDNWIPEMGGMVATQVLKGNSRLKSIPVIYFSANNDIHTLASNAGADSYLAKPFDIDELEKVIKRVIPQ